MVIRIAVNGAASSLYPSVQQIWNSATYPNADFDRLIVKGLTLCDWGAPPPSITTSPAHLQRLAHLNEQSGEGLALVVMAVTSEPSFGTHANPFANIALQGQSIDSRK